MARIKVITRDRILRAAYGIVRTEGFSSLTARRIAHKLKCSTQPIYLEFANMEELKSAVLQRVQDYLNKHVFSKSTSEQPLIDAYGKYIRFAEKEPAMFRAVYLEGQEGCEVIESFSRQRFLDIIMKDPNYTGVKTKTKKLICTELWIVATGIACLRTGQMVSLSAENVDKLLFDMATNLQVEKIEGEN